MEPQRWRKLGRIDLPIGDRAWMRSHAAVPFGERIDDRFLRLYVSGRDDANRSHTGGFVIDLADPLAVVEIDTEPILSPGRPGEFDAAGAMGCDLYEVGGSRVVSYIGWNLGVEVPFRNSIGLAVEDADGGYRRWGRGPVLDRSPHDPCFVASNCVRRVGSAWSMWYLSCDEWLDRGDRLEHRYNIKRATSSDGFAWRATGEVAIDFVHAGEYAISVPRVLERPGGGFEMFYSYRGGPFGPLYRIGYAESEDGRTWFRHDEQVDLEPTPGEWDGSMVCYPFPLDVDGRRLLFYNGDGYGETGVGVAVLD